MERTEIRFVAGIEPTGVVPAAMKTPGGLAHRFAVIQDTYRPDKDGMYFDGALCRRLLEFARGIAPGARVGIVASDRANEMDADDFLTANASIEAPPACLLVRANGTLEAVDNAMTVGAPQRSWVTGDDESTPSRRAW